MRVYLCVFCISISFHQLLAQVSDTRLKFHDDFQPNHVVKANLLSPLLGTLNFHYEWRLNANSSSQIELFYFTGQAFGQSAPLTGFGVTYNYRYYLTGTFPEGFFVQPYVRYQQFLEKKVVSGNGSSSVTAPTLGFNVYGGGMLLGYQFVFAKRVSLDLYGGPMYNISFEDGVRTTSQDYPPMFTGTFIRTGCTLGFTF